MMHRMVSARLLSLHTPSNLASRTYWRVGSLALAFGISIPLFAVIDDAWAVWIVVPLGVGLWSRARRRRQRTPS